MEAIMISKIIYEIQNELNIQELELVLKETKQQIKSMKRNGGK